MLFGDSTTGERHGENEAVAGARPGWADAPSIRGPRGVEGAQSAQTAHCQVCRPVLAAAALMRWNGNGPFRWNH
jgi:hypothetical protein